MNYEKTKKEILKKQKDLQPEIAREIWETNIDEMYNLFEQHKKNIMTNYSKGPERNTELSNLMSKKIEFAMKFSDGLYKDFMVIKLDSELEPSPCIIPPNVTELIIMPSDWYTGPIKTRLTEIPPSLFASEMIGYGITSGGFANTTLRIGPGITEIGDYAFSNPRFDKIYLPNTLEKIEIGAFEKCAFSTIHIPPSVKYIGSNAFAENDYLTSVTGMKGVTTIKSTPFNETKIDFIEIWKPLSEIDYESNWNGYGGSQFNMFYGTRLNKDEDNDNTNLYEELYEATLKREYYFKVLEKYTGTKLECGKNTPDDIKFCLLNLPSNAQVGGQFTEIIKFLGCRVLGYLKPDTLTEMSRLYGMGIRCFDFPSLVQPGIINELNRLVDGNKDNWSTWDSDDESGEKWWRTGEDGIVDVFGKLEPIHIIGYYKWTHYIMYLLSSHNFKVIRDDQTDDQPDDQPDDDDDDDGFAPIAGYKMALPDEPSETYEAITEASNNTVTFNGKEISRTNRKNKNKE
jgi:hypothetical protein